MFDYIKSKYLGHGIFFRKLFVIFFPVIEHCGNHKQRNDVNQVFKVSNQVFQRSNIFGFKKTTDCTEYQFAV